MELYEQAKALLDKGPITLELRDKLSELIEQSTDEQEKFQIGWLIESWAIQYGGSEAESTDWQAFIKKIEEKLGREL